MLFLSTLLISMFITMALIPILRTAAVRLGCGLDMPAARKVHCAPVPKVGGLAMAVGALVPVLLVAEGGRFVNAVLLGSLVLAGFGIADDFRSLSWKSKFAGQIAAALIVILYGGLRICSLGEIAPEGFQLPDAVCIPLTLLVIVGVTNAINLSDGLDGLAGGTSMLIFMCIGFLAFTSSGLPQQLFVMVLCAAVIGAIFGFLRFNTHPATIFMGDTGSQLLGFLAASLSLRVTQDSEVLSPLLPLLLLGFPVLDTLTVMVERIADGRPPFSPDKNHFHHKLMGIGLFHTEAVVAIYGITTLLAVAAFFLRFHSDWVILVLYAVFSGSVVTALAIAQQSGFRLKREGVFDIVVKGRLKVIKEKSLIIRTVFPPLEFGLPLLFIAAGLVPAAIPSYLSAVAAGCIVLVAGAWFLNRSWVPALLRGAVYFLVPIVLRAGQVAPGAWADRQALAVMGVAFAMLAFFIVMTLKSTRRRQGFKATPMDFLILVIALVVPNLPDPAIKSSQMGDLAVRIIVMFFGFEVLIGELRGRVGRLAAGIAAGLLLLAVRGIY
jgi:UDP-GlcNAc:undecaprenyl-phosphate GlcNAc-1-phosphate transferase